jgi:hypothetical protein
MGKMPDVRLKKLQQQSASFTSSYPVRNAAGHHDVTRTVTVAAIASILLDLFGPSVPRLPGDNPCTLDASLAFGRSCYDGSFIDPPRFFMV